MVSKLRVPMTKHEEYAWFIVFAYPHPEDDGVEVTINVKTHCRNKVEATRMSSLFHLSNPDQYVFYGKVP